VVAGSSGDLRAIDRETAVRILRAIDNYLSTGVGDVKKLQAPRQEYRLRVGDYRVLFLPKDELAIDVLRVRHRKEAYR